MSRYADFNEASAAWQDAIVAEAKADAAIEKHRGLLVAAEQALIQARADAEEATTEMRAYAAAAVAARRTPTP